VLEIFYLTHSGTADQSAVVPKFIDFFRPTPRGRHGLKNYMSNLPTVPSKHSALGCSISMKNGAK
jgi:hypothetical protein